ncbi:MAG: class I SAM-dependent methyltransferase, partial [Acidimicrobiales bacterium]
IDRYVFPDGELVEVGAVVSAMQGVGFEVRHVESLREHYDLTLHRWVANLEDNWDAAVASAGLTRARTWRLYLAAPLRGAEAEATSLPGSPMSPRCIGRLTIRDEAPAGTPKLPLWADGLFSGDE